MQTTTTPQNSETKAENAWYNYQLLKANLPRWKAEAKASKDYARQADLRGYEYSPEHWLNSYFMHSRHAISKRVQKTLTPCEIGYDLLAELDKKEAVERLLDFLETMPAKAISDLVEKLIDDVDEYDLNQPLAELEAQAA